MEFDIESFPVVGFLLSHCKHELLAQVWLMKISELELPLSLFCAEI